METRYPDFEEEPIREEAEEALRIAKRTLEWVREQMSRIGIECWEP